MNWDSYLRNGVSVKHCVNPCETLKRKNSVWNKQISDDSRKGTKTFVILLKCVNMLIERSPNVLQLLSAHWMGFSRHTANTYVKTYVVVYSRWQKSCSENEVKKDREIKKQHAHRKRSNERKSEATKSSSFHSKLSV